MVKKVICVQIAEGLRPRGHKLCMFQALVVRNDGLAQVRRPRHPLVFLTLPVLAQGGCLWVSQFLRLLVDGFVKQ